MNIFKTRYTYNYSADIYFLLAVDVPTTRKRRWRITTILEIKKKHLNPFSLSLTLLNQSLKH